MFNKIGMELYKAWCKLTTFMVTLELAPTLVR